MTSQEFKKLQGTLTNAQAADLLRVTIRTVQLWRQGKVKMPESMQELAKLKFKR